MDSTYLQHGGSTRRSSRDILSESEVETRIENLGIVFSLLNDKDVFKKFYSKLLAKRLIQASSASDESEKNIIRKLREICGHEFVSKLQRMFSDKDLSKVSLQ